MNDLGKLIAAVEAGNLHPLDLLCLDAVSHGRAQKAFDGSLDAAKELHEALLPDLKWIVTDSVLRKHDAEVGKEGMWFSARSAGPARAWLLAILRAYAAQQEPTS